MGHGRSRAFGAREDIGLPSKSSAGLERKCRTTNAKRNVGKAIVEEAAGEKKTPTNRGAMGRNTIR